MNALLRGYYAMPVWAQNLMLTAYGARLRFLRYGGSQARELDALLASERLPAEALRALQLERLNAQLRVAATSVPYYRRLGLPERLERLEDLAALPLLRKEEMRSHGTELVSTAGGGKPSLGIHTGGTTGLPLMIYCDRATLQRNYAFFGRLLRWAGVPDNPRVATLGGRTIVPPGQSHRPWWRRNYAMRTLMMSSYHIAPASVDAYLAALRDFQPDFIDAYPSSIEPLARRAVAAGITDIRPRAIVTSSETMFPAVRAMVEQAFGCQVFDYYGAGEMAAFVSQCERGSYHPNPEFGVLEVVTDAGRPAGPGEPGEIVATGFINPVMPLIRYATGDMAVQGGGPCACGRAFPVLERIEGRMDDVIITPEGRRIGRLDPIFKSAAAIVEARIVQDRTDHVRLEVVPDAGYSAAGEAVLLDELKRRLGPSMRVDVLHVPAIPRTRRGKLRMVVREVPGLD